MEEGGESEGGPDFRIAKRLQSVLQFVTDRAHELTPGRSTGVQSIRRVLRYFGEVASLPNAINQTSSKTWETGINWQIRRRPAS